MEDKIKLPVINVHQNIGNLYVGVIKAKDLYDIAFSDRIRLEDLKVPKYAGYQRALISERVDSIRDYLNTPESTFPNSIIVSIDSEFISNWEDIKNNHGTSILEIISNVRLEKCNKGKKLMKIFRKSSFFA